MDIFEIIETRRSIRQYDAAKPITKKDLEQVLRAAMYAPSAVDKRPWEFLVVTDADLLDKITKIHPYAAFVPDAGTAVIMCENKKKTYKEYGLIDLALAAQNLMLAAHSMGYGTCFCGVAPDTERMADFATLFDLPDHIHPMALIAIGTPKKQPKTGERFDAKKIHWGKF